MRKIQSVTTRELIAAYRRIDAIQNEAEDNSRTRYVHTPQAPKIRKKLPRRGRQVLDVIIQHKGATRYMLRKALKKVTNGNGVSGGINECRVMKAIRAEPISLSA